MKAIPSSTLDTAHAPRRDRFAIWHAALSPTHDVSIPEGTDPRDFNASARGWLLGGALLLESRAAPQILRRTPRKIRTDQTDHYIVRLQRRGRWLANAAGRIVETTAGSIAIIDMARPCDAQATEVDNLNLVLPRDMLDDALPPFDMHGLVANGAIGALLRDYLESLADSLPYLNPECTAGIADATCRLLAACLAPSRDNTVRAREPFAAVRLHQVRNYIDEQLCSPHLSAQSISAALGISRSTLYNVCEPMGGVSAFIQKRRLRRVHMLLADPHEQRRISEIAYLFGFVSNAHFSRVFRNAYGYSPREAREVSASSEIRVLDARDAYGNWIRRIGA